MYEFETDGVKITLPSFQKIPVGIMREASKLEDAEQVWFILESLLSPKELKTVYKLPLDEFSDHVKKWTGGVSLGE